MYMHIYIYVYTYIYIWRLLKRGVPPVIIQVIDHDLVKQPTVDLWCRSWSWPQLGQEWRLSRCFFWKLPGGMTWWNNRFLLQSVIFCKKSGFHQRLFFLVFEQNVGTQACWSWIWEGKLTGRKVITINFEVVFLVNIQEETKTWWICSKKFWLLVTKKGAWDTRQNRESIITTEPPWDRTLEGWLGFGWGKLSQNSRTIQVSDWENDNYSG